MHYSHDINNEVRGANSINAVSLSLELRLTSHSYHVRSIAIDKHSAYRCFVTRMQKKLLCNVRLQIRQNCCEV